MVDEETLAKLGELARQGTEPVRSPAQEAAGASRFVEAVAARSHTPSRSPAWRVGLAMAAAVLVATLALWFRPAGRLEVSVDGARLGDPYILASAEAPKKVQFSEGSAVALSPGSALRVVDVTAAGAELSLEEGSLDASIVHRPGARWSVNAGPCVVEVTGTEFSVDWSRSEQTMRVRLRHGGVRVKGRPVPDGVALREGQELVLRLPDGTARMGSLEASAAEVAPPAPASSDAPEPIEAAPEASGAPSGAASAGPAPPSWSKRVADGDFAGVLAEAERRGFDNVLQQSSLSDLVALSEAARYGKRADLTRRALLELRARFPQSSQAKSAAFLLGRMIDDGGSPGGALSWYDTYLNESPRGSFAAEALGRKMNAIRKTSGREAARPVAEEYLRRYPAGAHAHIARGLVNP